jgi:hypothetical protein
VEKIMKKTVILIIALIMVAMGALWGFGAYQSKSLIKEALEGQGVVYDKISVAGNLLEYTLRVTNPRLEEEGFMAPSIKVDFMDISLSSSSSSVFDFDTIGLSFPKGIDVDLGLMAVKLGLNPELKVTLNKEENKVEDIFVNLQEINLVDGGSSARLILDIEGIDAPMNADVSSVYKDRRVKLNKLLMEYENLRISANGFFLVKNEDLSTGWLDLNIKGYEPWLNFLANTEALPVEHVVLLKEISDKFVVSDMLEEKEIALVVNILDGEATINGQSMEDLMEELIAENPELGVFKDMFEAQMSSVLESADSAPESFESFNSKGYVTREVEAGLVKVEKSIDRYKEVHQAAPESIKVLRETFDEVCRGGSCSGEPFLQGSEFSNYIWDMSCSASSCDVGVDVKGGGWDEIDCSEFSPKDGLECNSGVLTYSFTH